MISRSLSLVHNPTEGALGQPGEGGGRRERWRAGVGESSSSSSHDLEQLYLDERMQTVQPPPPSAVLALYHGSIESPRPQTRNRLRCPQRGGEDPSPSSKNGNVFPRKILSYNVGSQSNSSKQFLIIKFQQVRQFSFSGLQSNLAK